jgi:hypothetical protein
VCSCDENFFLVQKAIIVGNFIKPGQSTVHDGAHPEEATCEEPEKDWRGHHDCKRYWGCSARWNPWCAIRIIWGPLHRGTWCRVCILEIRTNQIFGYSSRQPLKKEHRSYEIVRLVNDKRTKHHDCYNAFELSLEILVTILGRVEITSMIWQCYF